jgi:hypothetical protein
LSDVPEVQVSAVDSYQGREKERVFVSLLNTKEVGFLEDVGRVNVRLSRVRDETRPVSPNSSRSLFLENCLRQFELHQRLSCISNYPFESNHPSSFEMTSPQSSKAPLDSSRVAFQSHLQFPFIDWFPCIGHDHPESAMEPARQYFAITRPRIIVTFSGSVSSWVAANFVHPYGLSRSGLWFFANDSRNFVQHAGVPRIAYYDNPRWQETRDKPSTKTACIMMPHVHPGRVKYGKQPEALSRLIDLCWSATLALASYTMKELDNLGEQDELRLEEEICRKVIARYEIEAITLIQEMEKIKRDLERERSSQCRCQPFEPRGSISNLQMSTFHAQV